MAVLLLEFFRQDVENGKDDGEGLGEDDGEDDDGDRFDDSQIFYIYPVYTFQ